MQSSRSSSHPVPNAILNRRRPRGLPSRAPTSPPLGFPARTRELEGSPSKRQFQRHLDNAWVASRRHITEGTGINVALRSHKLRMVKGIEELGAIFEINFFLESHRLVKRQVEVVDPRPIEEAA